MKRSYSINDYTAGQQEAEEVKLSEPIALIGEISKKLNNKTKNLMPKDDLTKGMKLVLQCLVDKDGVTQLDIVNFTGLKPPTISILVSKMEQLGLITRTHDKFDLRAMRVSITDTGKHAYLESVKAVKQIEGKVLKGISDDEIQILINVLKKINGNLES